MTTDSAEFSGQVVGGQVSALGQEQTSGEPTLDVRF